MHGAPLFELPLLPCVHCCLCRDCPQCKTKRRASKTLSLARLPPILLIHLKRFEANGRFSDKVDTFVEYPMKALDLTNYMPPPLPPGADKSELNGGLPMSLEDPRTQLPPYRYDLYGVTNHYGNLSSGHCESCGFLSAIWADNSLKDTAFIASGRGWMSCDDSSVKPCDPKQVVVCALLKQPLIISHTLIEPKGIRPLLQTGPRQFLMKLPRCIPDNLDPSSRI